MQKKPTKSKRNLFLLLAGLGLLVLIAIFVLFQLVSGFFGNSLNHAEEASKIGPTIDGVGCYHETIRRQQACTNPVCEVSASTFFPICVGTAKSAETICQGVPDFNTAWKEGITFKTNPQWAQDKCRELREQDISRCVKLMKNLPGSCDARKQEKKN